MTEDRQQGFRKRDQMIIAVSGAAGGIGSAITRKFIDEGHQVYGFDLRESAISHPLYHHHTCDICAKNLPSVPEPDVVIMSAGTIDEEEAIRINLMGTIDFAESFIGSSALKSVLFIASASARNGAEFPYYVASKAGLVGYMKNLALKLAPRGITVNSMSPGGVVTDMNKHILESEKLYDAVKAETLLGKWAEPEEIADLAYYLTAVNKSMTGEDILIDNGEMLKSNFIW